MRDGGGMTSSAIHVVIAGMPNLLAAVVRKAVEMERDIVIVAQVDKPEALTASIAKTADVIVTAAADRTLAPQYLAGLFGERPIPVVAISADGNSIDVYGRWATHGYGLAGLISLIREAAAGSHLRCGS
jgi:hypothetical protein